MNRIHRAHLFGFRARQSRRQIEQGSIGLSGQRLIQPCQYLSLIDLPELDLIHDERTHENPPPGFSFPLAVGGDCPATRIDTLLTKF